MLLIRKVKRVRNILYNRHAVSLLSIFTTCLVIFLMTGAFYFRNQIIITDGDNTYSVLTMQTSAENIIAEQGISLSGLDYYSFGNTGGNQLTLSITRSFGVTVTADGIEFKTEAYQGETIGEILQRAGVTVGEHDVVTPEYDRFMEGSTIKVIRAFAVYARVDGELHEFFALPDDDVSIADILESEGFKLGAEDIVSDNYFLRVKPGITAEVTTIRYNNRIDINLIPYETKTLFSDTAALGSIRVATAGEEGEVHVLVREKYVEGVRVSEEILTSEIGKEPVEEVLVEGRAIKEPISPREFDEIELVNGIPVNYERKLTGKSTAYTAGPASGTASGRPLVVGTVAVDPKAIPYGSLLYIITTDGSYVYGAAVAADTGAFTYENGVGILVDVYMGLTSENIHKARNWGAREVDVYIINEGKY